MATRYVEWLQRHARAIVAAHVLGLVAGLYLVAFHLPLRADFSYLLPQDAPAVRDLRKLEARVQASDTVLVLVTAPAPELRAAAVTSLAAELRALPRALVEQVTTDHRELQRFLEAHRHLLAPLEDLVRARDALARHLGRAVIEANPLYLELDDPDPAEEQRDRAELEELRARSRAAQERLARLSNVSADGRVAVIQLRTAFRATNAERGAQLIAALGAIRARVLAAHPAVDLGLTGNVITAVAEHRAIARGMLVSSLITGGLVALVLALYLRSATLLALLIGTLVTATVMAFGVSALTVGHLNAATAFLAAIIAGNGVNYGILLLARYLAERRRHDVEPALAAAIASTLRPTAIASLGAAIAYGSLAATSFKGFADFAVIGAVGMVVVWAASYVLLPALVLRLGRATRPPREDALLGRALVRVLGSRRAGAIVAAALVVSLGAAVIVARYLAGDPFEYDLKRLRSQGADASAARAWMTVSDRHFGRGLSGRTVIAADQLEQVPRIVEALRARDRGVPAARQTIGEVWSILSFVPAQQAEKLAVIRELRTLIDTASITLDAEDRAELLELRPPDALGAIGIELLPPSLRERFTEKDGRVGFLVEVRPANELDEWNGRDLIRFAQAVRRLELADGERVTTSGASVVFADILASIERDGPRVTLLAALGLVVMVLLLVGFTRRALAVLAATALGSLLMVAVCALLDLRINFLDFVALPITLGLGIDYAINVGHGDDRDPIETLRTSGSAVFVCSLTTIIGYASLLASDNLAIRGFGTASLIGEIACVLTALLLVPAILAVGRRIPIS